MSEHTAHVGDITGVDIANVYARTFSERREHPTAVASEAHLTGGGDAMDSISNHFVAPILVVGIKLTVVERELTSQAVVVVASAGGEVVEESSNRASEIIAYIVADCAAIARNAERRAMGGVDGTLEGEHIAAATRHVGHSAPRGGERGCPRYSHNLIEGNAHGEGAAHIVRPCRHHRVAIFRWCCGIDQRETHFQVLEVPVVTARACRIEADVEVVDGGRQTKRAGIGGIIGRRLVFLLVEVAVIIVKLVVADAGS